MRSMIISVLQCTGLAHVAFKKQLISNMSTNPVEVCWRRSYFSSETFDKESVSKSS